MADGKVIDMKGQPLGRPQGLTFEDYTKFDTATCTNCGGIFFESVMLFKKVPAMKSPNGKAHVQPFEIVRCTNCGQPHEELNPMDLL